jgi:hypothetical protein
MTHPHAPLPWFPVTGKRERAIRRRLNRAARHMRDHVGTQDYAVRADAWRKHWRSMLTDRGARKVLSMLGLPAGPC